LTSFSTLGLSEPLLRALDEEGYSNPTPIQERAIPVLNEGRDLVGIAQTGTGKTAAFCLPLLNRLAQDRRRPPGGTCRVLILAPTRELAIQIVDSLKTYGRHLRLSYALVIGGANPRPQVQALRAGTDVLVATPGRLLDHMGGGIIKLNLTTEVVLDEADQMLDLGFMPAIRRILRTLPQKRQTLLFSATMPKEIRALAADFLNDPVEVAVTPAARPVELVEQRVLPAPTADKRRLLTEVLKAPEVERAIVFTRTKHGADRVARHLQQAGIESAAIHGNKSQNQRQRSLTAFREGEVLALVATDIAARGLDIDGVSHVVNYELPNVPEAYVHRIGRTARAGASGVAISLMDESERGLMRAIESLIGRRLVAGNDAPPRKAAPRPERRTQPAAKPKARPNGSRSAQRERRAEDREFLPGSEANDAGLQRLLTTSQRPRRRRSRQRPAA